MADSVPLYLNRPVTGGRITLGLGLPVGSANKLIGDASGNPIEISFNTEDLPEFPTEKDIEFAKANNEFLQLRMKNVALKGLGTNPLTPGALMQFFAFDPDGKNRSLIDNKPKGESWENKAEIACEYVFVKKTPLFASGDKTWAEQEALLAQYGKTLAMQGIPANKIERRTATEAMWDTIMYYWKNREHHLQHGSDRLKTTDDEGDNLIIGHPDTRGVHINQFPKEASLPTIAVYPQRRNK